MEQSPEGICEQKALPRLSDAVIGVVVVYTFIFILPLSTYYILHFLVPTYLNYAWLSNFIIFITLVWMIVFSLWMQRNRRLSSMFKSISLRSVVIEGSLALATAILLIIFIAVINAIWPESRNNADRINDIAGYGQPAITITFALMAMFMSPIAEELFYRGFLFRTLRIRFGLIIACILQSTVFAFTHLYSPSYVVIIFVYGIAFSLLYAWRKTLLSPILAHFWLNLVPSIAAIILMINIANTPYLGVSIDNDTEGIRVLSVAPGSGAEDAGIMSGDIITQIEGKPVDSMEQLITAVREKQIGDTVSISLIRDEQQLELPVNLKKNSP